MQSGSCVSLLLSITYKIYKSIINKNFDFQPPTDMSGTFLDISKTFDKVWEEGLIFKLKTYGLDDNLLKLLENYLTDLQHGVVLTFSGQNIYAGVLQSFVLRSLLFF